MEVKTIAKNHSAAAGKYNIGCSIQGILMLWWKDKDTKQFIGTSWEAKDPWTIEVLAEEQMKVAYPVSVQHCAHVQFYSSSFQ